MSRLRSRRPGSHRRRRVEHGGVGPEAVQQTVAEPGARVDVGSVGRQAAGVAKTVHLSVIDGASGLNPAIMALSDDLSRMDQNRTDGYASFGEALVRLLDGGAEIRICSHVPARRSSRR